MKYAVTVHTSETGPVELDFRVRKARSLSAALVEAAKLAMADADFWQYGECIAARGADTSELIKRRKAMASLAAELQRLADVRPAAFWRGANSNERAVNSDGLAWCVVRKLAA